MAEYPSDRARQQVTRTKRRLRRGLRLRPTAFYYRFVALLLALVVLFFGLSNVEHGVVGDSPELARTLHLSPLFVVHEPDGDHHHTILGDFAFGKDPVYMRCFDQVVVDGTVHVDGEHVRDTRRYGQIYMHATKEGNGC